jgi:hypothetical protein
VDITPTIFGGAFTCWDSFVDVSSCWQQKLKAIGIYACLVSLEARDVLKTKMKKPWRVDWSNYEQEIADLPEGSVGINTRLDTD